ncbi:MAG: hypothetical protein IPJ11_03720 [Gemmatimonadetes bacterium]|nr:hypothetical protein [Gemmatimonadota bacterium]
MVADRSSDTELGKGTVDLKTFLAAIPQLDQKPVMVEQEGGPDPMASAKRNAAYLRSIAPR